VVKGSGAGGGEADTQMTKRATRLALTLAALAALCGPGTPGAEAYVATRRKASRQSKPAVGVARAAESKASGQGAESKASEQADGPASGRLKTYALRLKPGQDLRRELESFARARGLRAGFVLTAVGSLTKAALRLADQPDATEFEGKFEIVSLVGTLSPDGVHLHLSLSDKTGRTIGGHLVEGCVIYTTAELVVGEIEGLRFTREQDAQTGYKELRVRRAPRKGGR
jgi:uncharacterized protein